MENAQHLLMGLALGLLILRIKAVVSAAHGDSVLNWGPYFEYDFQDSEFILRLHENFQYYEEHETSHQMKVLINFACIDSTNNAQLSFVINVQDTNNNPPAFRSRNGFSVTVKLPLPPGYQLTGCLEDIIVRDIDLTNYRIDFSIAWNEYIDISYGDIDNDDPKLHYAVLQTKSYIKTFSQIYFYLTATDVDLTGDPRRSTSTTFTIKVDDQFVLPEEPIFSEDLYHASYTWEHELVIDKSISLREGFDADVRIRVIGNFEENFEVIEDSDSFVTFEVKKQLPVSVTAEKINIHLVLLAERDLTVGSTAIVVVRLPQRRILAFDYDIYSGTIQDGIFDISTIMLEVGYQDNVQFSLTGEHAKLFRISNVGAMVTINLQEQVDANMISQNDFIMIILEACGLNAVSAQVIITFDISKTPIFPGHIYYGKLDGSVFEMDTINLVHDHEDTTFILEGANAEWFVAKRFEYSVTIALNSQIPNEVMDDNPFFAFTLKGRRGVLNAHATIIITIIGGCRLQNVTNWLIPINLSVQDIQRGEIYRATATNIDYIVSASHGDGAGGGVLNWGPYFEYDFQDSEFILRLHDNFQYYEKHETSHQMNVLINFSCAGSTNKAQLKFVINVQDTNNNSPAFVPSDGFSFTVKPPLPPGYQLTHCFEDIKVRDIDLTNYKIDFWIEENEYFEIGYGNFVADNPKFHHAILQTKSFIKRLPESMSFQIEATDVDLTGDPRRSVFTTIFIESDTQFVLPDEPIFSEPLYYANYTWEHELVLEKSISLRQGFDADVRFRLQDNENFEVIVDSNGFMTLEVRNPLSNTEMEVRTHIYLVLLAEQDVIEHRSTTTIVIRIQQPRTLAFDQEIYKGTIQANLLNMDIIKLKIGYEDDVQFSLSGDFDNMFGISRVGNAVMINLLEEFDEHFYLFYNSIILTIEAYELNAVSAQATIIFAILYVAPVFNKNIYYGTFDGSVFEMETIYLLRGYEHATFIIEGADSEWFVAETVGHTITIFLKNQVPTEVLDNIPYFDFTIKLSNGEMDPHATIIITILHRTTEQYAAKP